MISPDEARAVLAEVERQRRRPPPSDPSAAGCVVASVALVAAVLMPFIGRALALSSTAMLVTGATLGTLALVSGLLGIFGGGRVQGAVATEVEEAVRVLASESALGHQDRAAHGEDPDEKQERIRLAAVRLLTGAWVPAGPARVSTFDAEQVARRIGGALAYVEELERYLVERGEIEPVFTSLDEKAVERDPRPR